METFSHIVSLGERCATTHHVRRFFNFGDAYPFDWWITPFDGLLQVLERPDIDWLYDPDLIHLTDQRRSVVHEPTGILFHHEFAREPAGPEAHISRPVCTDFLQRTTTPRARTAALLGKLFKLNAPGNRILFIREEGDPERLALALEPHFSNADWTLKVIPVVRSPHFKPVGQSQAQQWQGDPVVWDRVLAQLNSRLDNPSLKRFSPSRPIAESAISHDCGG